MFCILIPTVNRKDLLMEALPYYVMHYFNHHILILDNGNQGIHPMSSMVKVFVSPQNLGVARSWNYLVQKGIGMGYDYFLVLNDDIVYKGGPGRINALIEEGGQLAFHQPRPHYNWSIFLFSKWVFQKVGQFDPEFKKCFFEDDDYKYRMKMAGIDVRWDDALAPEIYRNSETTKRSPELGGYVENRDYFIRKWGGLPLEEKFTTPFNQ